MQRISPPKTSINSESNFYIRKNQLGFTLIEIMIVLGILTALVAVGLPRINRNNNNIKQVSRQLAVLAKEIRNQSRLKNMTHRLVFNMTDKESTYWVEAASGLVLVAKDSDKEKSSGEKSANPFQKSEKFFKKDRVLPGDLKFKSIETISHKEATTSGLAYIYFTPEGMVEKSTVQIGKGDLTWTLIFNPLTGHADIVETEFSLKDLPKL